MKLYPHQEVVVNRDVMGDVPKGTRGVVVRQDYGDTDFRTYEVRFSNGVTAYEVREYWLDRVPALVD